MFQKINCILDTQDRYHIIKLAIFTIVFALIETSAVALIMPFIAIATDFKTIEENEYLHGLYTLIEPDTQIDFILTLGIALILFYIFRFCISLLYNYQISKFARGKYAELSTKLLTLTMEVSYDNFTSKNSSELTKNIIQETQNFSTSILYFMNLLSELLVFICIYCVMLYVHYQLTLVITLLFGFCVLILHKTASKELRKQGRIREQCQKEFFAMTASSFGNFKLLKLIKSGHFLIDEFKKTNIRFFKSNIYKDIYSIVPKYFIETFAFILLLGSIVLLIYIEQSDISSYMALFSLFAVSLYRLMPSLSKIINNYNALIYNYRSIDILYELLHEKIEIYGVESIDFQNYIELKDVSFAYNNTNNKLVLDKINMKINKNDKIAFIGASGSGKSTLVDLLIGIHQQSSGSFIVDAQTLENRHILSWRYKVGYIPQNVYLFDGTVAENIALGLKVDEKKVCDVLKKAKIYDYLTHQLEGIHTHVGDAGLKLSGGQKQRIAIARALYKDPEILVLDEATSALDEATEAKIMEEIYELSADKTLFIIAHRLSTIQNCNKVFRVENKTIRSVREK
jgi:ABC-type multidrug transport system fused ATPase/permease subunit